MYAEKFELLEAKIREIAMLVSRLREEKQRLEQENEQFRERIEELEEELQRSQDYESRYVPNLDNLLQQLETLQEDEADTRRDPVATAMQELLAKETKTPEDHFHLGGLYEQQGHLEQAISEYQLTLEFDTDNLDVAQRLAFLLEKLNRDAEASPLWEKIWAMREAQANTKRRRMR
jgi:lipopolysaccharide biosynthesis regulator YciM